jgi:hypothetical protein
MRVIAQLHVRAFAPLRELAIDGTAIWPARNALQDNNEGNEQQRKRHNGYPPQGFRADYSFHQWEPARSSPISLLT